MPINNIQFRAEIGTFNSVMNCIIFRIKIDSLQLIINYLQIFCLITITKILSSDKKSLFSFFIHLLCFFTTCLVFPLVTLLAVIFCSIFNFYINFPNLYVYVWFIFNLFSTPIVYHKAFARFLTRYCLFVQICLFLPFLKRALIMSGDIKTNPGPVELDNQNLSLCHWNLNVIQPIAI